MRRQIITLGRFFTGATPGGGTSLQGEFFFSTDHCQPTEYLKNGADWVPCSIGIPMIVTERPGLEDGLVDSLEKYLLVFHTRELLIANPCPKYKVDFEDEVLASRGNPEAAPLESLIPLKYPKVSPCPLLDCCELHGDMCSDCHPEEHKEETRPC
jgi:hypothetical protein